MFLAKIQIGTLKKTKGWVMWQEMQEQMTDPHR